MDAMITSMCNQGIGRLGYAIVLVEVNADKFLANHIDVMYRNSENGHADNRCPRMVNKNEQNQNIVKDNKGFISKVNKRFNDQERVRNKQQFNNGSSEWVIMGDVNVSLNLEDHSEGMSNFTQDMIDFKECINEIEIKDINSSSLHFTWVKSLLNPSSSILKKIDRVMAPTILKVPQAMKKKKKSFRVANYVIYKMEFKELVKEKWNTEIQGHYMYSVELLKDYKEAVLDEEKLLRQKIKITWLKEGDKNSAYFYKVLKGRINRNRIMSICAKNGRRFENCEVANQFVKHFKGFLGISPAVTRLNEDDDHLFVSKISEEEAKNMIREINDEEIKKSLF
ncbi:RNA-directed DNA polymerase, eukaryota, reverse transcriptase zinc-binding domain protein [Tanacetum coccineum]